MRLVIEQIKQGTSAACNARPRGPGCRL